MLKDGDIFCAVVESTESGKVCNNPVELGYTFKSRDELEYAFSILKVGGKVKTDICRLPWSPCAAAVTDCFGVNWYLTLQEHRPPEDWVPE